MKWIKPDGTQVTINDENEANAECAKNAGWKPVKGSKKVKLYKRLEGEIVEGDENPPENVIVDSESFLESSVDSALKDGWFKTEEEAAHAPPDKAKVSK